MPRYWVCNRCGTYNLEPACETCGLTKEEAMEYEEIVEKNPMDYDDQEDFIETLLITDDLDDWDDSSE